MSILGKSIRPSSRAKRSLSNGAADGETSTLPPAQRAALAAESNRAWRRRQSRRAFMGNTLKGAAGAAVATPLLLEGNARAQTAHPKRVLFMFSPNGTQQETFWPYFDWSIFDGPKSETNFPLTPILSPLEAHRQDIVVLDGVQQRSTSLGPGDGHQKGMGHLLTGVPLQEGTLFAGGGDSGTAGWAGGVSVDQYLAQQIGGSTRFRSLELGVGVSEATVWSRMSYAAAGQPVPPENSPQAVFDRVFSDINADPVEVARRKARRRSVLDAVIGDFGRVQAKLGAADRQKLEQHLTSVREIESQLAQDVTLSENCSAPVLGPDGLLDPMAPSNFPAVGRLQMDLLVNALACDLTRVASLQWTYSVSDLAFTWLGIQQGHHGLSHEGASNTTAQNALTAINTWYAEQFAYLIQKMKEIPEGDGTLLDNTVIVWCNELGQGSSHTRQKIPFVLAGSCGGAWQTGRYLDYDNLINNGAPHNNLWVSILNAMGVPDDRFGHPLHCTGPLEGLA